MLIMFWICLLGSIFSYFLYPLIVVLVAGKRPGAAAEGTAEPSITLIVTAYNEESRIRDKIINSLALEYPDELLEIIVASDCSSDATDDIVMEYANRGIILKRPAERLGKENAQQAAIEAAGGDLLVFSDVSTQIPKDSLARIVREFDDPRVGAVSSVDRLIIDGAPAGEGVYVRYEMWLRAMESRAAGLVGMSGSFFAARREVCQPWDIGSPSDFSVALNARRVGMRAISSGDVLGLYPNLKDESKEYARKLRTILRGMSGLSRNLDVLNPLRFGFFSFQVFGHKLMRWLTPWFLIGLLVTSVTLAPENLFVRLALFAQLAFYLLAIAGWVLPAARRLLVVKLAYFFTLVNVATMHAALKFMKGDRMLAWQPSKR